MNLFSKIFRRRTESLYAAPNILPGGDDDGGDPAGEKPGYPKNYAGKPVRDDRQMVDVYAGPGMMRNFGRKGRRNDPGGDPQDELTPIETVYAGPDMFDGEEPQEYPNNVVSEEERPMAKVCAGPRPSKKEIEKLTSGVYAGPIPPDGPDAYRPPMMPVYAGPEVMAKGGYAGTELPQEANGTIKKGRFCPDCGKLAEQGAKFCTECGAELPPAETP